MSAERESTGGAVVDPLGGLVLDPSNELRFKGPFDDYVTVSLTIRNPTEKRVAFKIKTTAPKRYCVKPNSGVLDRNQSMKVNVLLQPFNYDPNEKNKHKFMVQYIYLTDEEMQLSVNEILNLWKDVSPSRLLDMKLKCLFEFTEAEQQKLAQQQQINENGNSGQQPNPQSNSSTSAASAATAPDSRPASVQQQKSTSSTTSGKSQQQASARQSVDTYSTAIDTHNVTAVGAVEANDFESKPYSNTNANNSSKPTNLGARQDKNDNLINELKLENDTLKKEIARLKEEESRLRKLALSSSGSFGAATASRTQPAGGSNDLINDILNNRLVYVIIILVAIIFYMLLFR